MGVGRLEITPWPKRKRVPKQSPVALKETHTSSTKSLSATKAGIGKSI